MKKAQILLRLIPALVAGMSLFAPPVQADVIAYWRFEEGSLGNPVPASGTGGDVAFANTVLDSSGHGNHLRTYDTNTAPTYIPANDPSVPATGAGNTLALDFGNGNRDLYTAGNPIGSQVFNQWTVEASVRVDVHDRWQVFVGKDGKPSANLAEPPFWLKHSDASDLFELMAIDSTETARLISSNFIPELGQWYHLAGVSDGSNMSFYIKGPSDSDYVLQGTLPFTGSLINSTADWTVGRGAWDGGITDWIDGGVDEVRISNEVFAPSEFLFAASTVPEPSSLLLLGAGMLYVARTRRKD